MFRFRWLCSFRMICSTIRCGFRICWKNGPDSSLLFWRILHTEGMGSSGAHSPNQNSLEVLFSCCVDEVAAQHVNAECILHYGDACMSDSEGRIPVRYVFARTEFDQQDFRDQIFKFDFSAIDQIDLVIDLSVGHVCEVRNRSISFYCCSEDHIDHPSFR